MAKKGGYSRYFTGITYVGSSFVNSVLIDKKTSIRSYAYILHDKDVKDDGTLKEPHIHFLLRTYSSWTCEQICKWFKGCIDSNGLEVNTLCEIASDINSCYEYLTHDGIDDKVLYSKDNIISYNVDEICIKRDSKDDCYDIVEAILHGVSPRELVRRYGRDYVYHKKQYEEVCYDIKISERTYD